MGGNKKIKNNKIIFLMATVSGQRRGEGCSAWEAIKKIK